MFKSNREKQSNTRTLPLLKDEFDPSRSSCSSLSYHLTQCVRSLLTVISFNSVNIDYRQKVCFTSFSRYVYSYEGCSTIAKKANLATYSPNVNHFVIDPY